MIGLLLWIKSLTFGDVAEKWLKTKQYEVAAQTYQNYTYCVRRTLNCYTALKITSINEDMLQNFLYDYAKTRHKRTIERLTRCIKNIFDYAHREGYIPNNPTKNLRNYEGLGIMDRPVYTWGEIKALLESTKDDEYIHAAIFLSITTGMRRGEIYALSWNDVDFLHHFITVKHSLSYVKKELIVGPTKTKSSMRRIDIDQYTEKLLAHFLGRHNKYVFANSKGEIQYKKNFNFRKICDAARIPPRRFHDLRHTHAAIQFSNNISPIIVKERFGHTSALTTMRYYGHVLPTVQKIAAETIEKELEDNFIVNKKEIINAA